MFRQPDFHRLLTSVRTRAAVSCLYSGFGKSFSQELPWASHSGIERSTGPISNFLPHPQRGSLPAKPSSRPGETSLCISNFFSFFQATVPFSMCRRCSGLCELTTLVLQDSSKSMFYLEFMSSESNASTS